MQRRNFLLRTAAAIALIALTSIQVIPAFAANKGGQKAKATVVIIKADWCTDCQRLAPKMGELIKQYGERLNFVLLDVTDDAKTAASAETARKLGLTSFFEENKKKTSTVAIFGKGNKLLFKTFRHHDEDAYVKAFDDAIARTS